MARSSIWQSNGFVRREFVEVGAQIVRDLESVRSGFPPRLGPKVDGHRTYVLPAYYAPCMPGGVHPKAVGDASAAMVLARLVQAGKAVLVPFGENHRYDLLIDEVAGFVRVQCKTGRIRRGAIWFPTCSSTYHHPRNGGLETYKHNYNGQADFFGVYCPDNDSVYMVPVDAVGNVSATLRLDPPRNGQAKKIRWAAEFQVRSPG